MLKKSGIKGIDTYLKERKWKVRAGGNRHASSTDIEYQIIDNDLFAVITNSKEDFFQWIKVLGKSSIKELSKKQYEISLKFRDKVYTFSVRLIDNRLQILVKKLWARYCICESFKKSFKQNCLLCPL